MRTQNKSRLNTLTEKILIGGSGGAFLGISLGRIIRPIHIEILDYIKLLAVYTVGGLLIGIMISIIFHVISISIFSSGRKSDESDKQ